MALVAPVENGKIVETASQASVKKSTKSSKSGMDKEAFLQLLVAQMKYQDPLEPTSNTEYISHYGIQIINGVLLLIDVEVCFVVLIGHIIYSALYQLGLSGGCSGLDVDLLTYQ